MKPLELRQTEAFSEVKLPLRAFDPTDPKSYKKLREISAGYLVEINPRTGAKLVKRPVQPAPYQRLKALTIVPNRVARFDSPRFEVTLREPTNTVVNVMLMMERLPMGSMSIPPGETLFTLTAPLPWNVRPGMNVVTAMASEDDLVTANLEVR